MDHSKSTLMQMQQTFGDLSAYIHLNKCCTISITFPSVARSNYYNINQMIFFSFKRNEYLKRFALKAGSMVNVFKVSLAIKRSFIKQMTSRQCQTFPQYIQNFPHIFLNFYYDYRRHRSRARKTKFCMKLFSINI